MRECSVSGTCLGLECQVEVSRAPGRRLIAVELDISIAGPLLIAEKEGVWRS
jgi:hypothetical protein